MSNTAVRAWNIGKRYQIGAAQGRQKTLRGALMASGRGAVERTRALARDGMRRENDETTLWALRDVSFEVEHGEAVGIIGRNGAGKSTLLKILSRITKPTTGRLELYGRVGSLLEVGTGFHPELTGRENIYLNGAILGMSRADIARKFDEIVAFAEVEKFLDTPVKHYSSGMHVRLAFAVAAHLEPELLIVDEVLAVGDAAFQKKCLGKMGEVAQGGRTVLFVSHNMAAVRRLCRRGLLLHQGEIVARGDVGACIETYLASAGTRPILSQAVYRAPFLKLHSVTVNGSADGEVHLSGGATRLEIAVEGELARPLHLELEVRFFDIFDTALAYYSPGHVSGHVTRFAPGRFTLQRTIELLPMMRGEYLLSLSLTDPNKNVWVELDRAVRLVSEGTPTATGEVFDYHKGLGWVLLPRDEKMPEVE
jgi:lipopolysaccharide transport system ATP-binding protein